MDDNRKKALAAALGQIEKQFGKGSVMRLGDGGVIKDMESISTGSIGLDTALGIGGLPKGRVVEIYGPEASGKTTLALQVIAQAQQGGGNAAFVDAEHALDPGHVLVALDVRRHRLGGGAVHVDRGTDGLEHVEAVHVHLREERADHAGQDVA